ADVDDPTRYEQMAIARMARRNHAIEKVDAALDGGDDVLRKAHTHQISRPLGRDVRHQLLEHPQTLLVRLTDRQASHGETRPLEPRERIERGEAQRRVHAALDDPEESTRRLTG